MSCMTILFYSCQLLDQTHVKWAVNQVIADDHFNLRQGFAWICMGYRVVKLLLIVIVTVIVIVMTYLWSNSNCNNNRLLKIPEY